jgi:predicted nucleotidyltransferase
MEREKIVAILREHSAEIQSRGVVRLGLFGSTARGDSGEASDIDIVVDIAPGRKFSLLDLAGLRAFLCDLFQHDADVVIREDLRPGFRAEIERETLRVL